MRALRTFVVVLSTGLVAQQGCADDRNPIAPDADVQSRLDRVVRIATDRKAKSWDHAAAIEKELREIAEKDPEKLVQQVLSCRVQSAAESEERSLVVLQLIDYFRIPDTAIVHAVIPYMGTPNEHLRDSIDLLLRSVEGRGPPGHPDYSSYSTWIRLSKNEPPRELVRRMYQRCPGTALLTMREIYVREPERVKGLLWAEHVISDTIWKHRHGFLPTNTVESEAATQVAKLAKDDAWWVRLYVAEILRQHPAFRTPELVERLTKDPHELVRDAITRPEPKKRVGTFPPPQPPTKAAWEKPTRK